MSDLPGTGVFLHNRHLDSHRRAVQRASPGKIETETADDFTLRQTTVITQPKNRRAGALGRVPENIKEFEIEAYHVFHWMRLPPLTMCPRESTVLRMSKSIRPRA